MKMKFLSVRILILFWLGLASIVHAQNPITSSGEISDQTLLLIAHTNGKAITVKQSFLKPIPFYDRHDERDTYHYTLLTKTNQVLYSGDFPNPLERWVDDFTDPDNPKGGRETIAENEFVLKIPYFSTAARIRCERIDASDKAVPCGVSTLPKPE